MDFIILRELLTKKKKVGKGKKESILQSGGQWPYIKEIFANAFL